MIRPLLITTGVSLALGLIAISAAGALVTKDLKANDWGWTFEETGDINGDTRIHKVAKAKDLVITTKTLAFDPGQTLIVDTYENVIFEQGPEPRLEATGTEEALKRLKIEGSRFYIEDTGDSGSRVSIKIKNGHIEAHSSQDLKIKIIAPNVTRFEHKGSGDLEIAKLDQTKIEVELSGSGDVSLSGKVRETDLILNGSGRMEAENLISEAAVITLNGSGDIDIAPSKSADVTINGSGDVNLESQPDTMKTKITGSGEVNQ
jgi:carbon monoxide dehydrogenase subunit G